MREVLQMRVSVSNIQTRDSDILQRLVHDKIRRAISDKIAGIAIKETQHECHREYACRVIVADYEDYWKDVKETADRISYRGMSPVFREEGLK